ncbi:MAG: tetratricopeptide repeat protein [Catalinimonas sp.]
MAKTKAPKLRNTPDAKRPGGAVIIDEQEGVLESPEALRERLGRTDDFFRRHQKMVLAAAVVIALLIAGIAFYLYNQGQREEQAQEYIFPAVYYFEADSLNKALDGDGVNYGMVYIADEYGNTAAGNLASFYAGAIYLRQGEYQQAVDRLEDVDTDDLLVQARAYALLGDAYMELENYDAAISEYRKAANYRPNEAFTPGYLMKLGLAYEMAERPADAATAYGQIVDKYPQAQEVTIAKQYRATAEAAAAE